MTLCFFKENQIIEREKYKAVLFLSLNLKNGALSGTRTHATGFGDLYSIQLSYERARHIITKKMTR